MCASNGKGKRSVAVRNTPHRTGTHMSCGSQCYLPPGGGDIPALTRNRSWYSIKRPRTDARLSWPGYVAIWYTRPKAVTHPSRPTNRNFVPYLCQLVFAAIVWVKLSEIFVTVTSLNTLYW